MSPDQAERSLDGLTGFEHTVRLASIDPIDNRHHSAALTRQPTRWGEVALLRTWGRLHRPGRSRATVYADRASARADIRCLLRRRLRHGYRVVERR